jgi:hypothetical protein
MIRPDTSRPVNHDRGFEHEEATFPARHLVGGRDLPHADNGQIVRRTGEVDAIEEGEGKATEAQTRCKLMTDEQQLSQDIRLLLAEMKWRADEIFLDEKVTGDALVGQISDLLTECFSEVLEMAGIPPEELA